MSAQMTPIQVYMPAGEAREGKLRAAIEADKQGRFAWGGHSSDLPGDVRFCLYEPDGDAPVAVCVDDRTGEEYSEPSEPKPAPGERKAVALSILAGDGIGPAKARSILELFDICLMVKDGCMAELEDCQGIGPKLAKRIRENIEVVD